MMNKAARIVLSLCLLGNVSLFVSSEDPGSGEDGGELDDYGGDESYGGEGGGYGGEGGYGGDDYGGGEYGGGGGEDGPTTPAFELLEDVEAVEKFLAEEDTEPAVIGFFNDETHKEDMETFEATAEANRYDLRFAYTVKEDVRTAFKANSGSHVNVYKPPRFVNEKYDKKKARYPGKKVDETALMKFAKAKALPLVGQKTWKSNDRYDASALPVLTLFVDVDLEKNGKGFDYYANRVRRVATDFGGKMLFNVGDKGDFSYTLTDFDLDLPGKKDIGAGIKLGNAHYGMAESFSVDNLRAFVESYFSGALVPKIKEEPDPADNNHEEDGYGGDDEGGGDEDDGSPSAVVTLTDDNFEAVVNAPGVDVLVEFYAPWCGHCMQLKPTYKKVAAAFEGVATVTVAAMDATAHTPPDSFDVAGYPTLIFVKGDAAKTQVPYDGGRDVGSMVEYIKNNAATPVKDEL